MTKKVNSSENEKPVVKTKTVRKASKRGMYTAAVSALVVAIVIVFNLVIGGLPSGTLEYDISGKDIYTVTEQSANYLKTLDKDVSIVVLSQSDAIDQHLLKFINNYAKLSSHLKLQIVDPVLDPTALKTYNAKENNVVVKCDATNKSKVLDLGQIQGYGDGLILYDANYYQYYQQLKPVELDAEGLLTSAVSSVTSTTTNNMYLLTGHGEGTLGKNAASLISKANIATPSLNLLTAGSIPSDCQLLLCYNPSKDLNSDELSMLESYLKNGGKLLLLLDNPALANFNALMAVYGLQMQNGYVGDNDRYYKYYAQQYGIYCIDPVLSTGSDVTTGISTDAILLASRGLLQVTAERRSAVITPFMTTSANGALTDDKKNTTKGQYILGATATETFTDKPGVETRLTVITGGNFISDQVPADAGFSNYDIFMNAVVKNYKDVQNISIPAKSLELEPTNLGASTFLADIFVCLIPVALLGGGIIYWIRRRNR